MSDAELTLAQWGAKIKSIAAALDGCGARTEMRHSGEGWFVEFAFYDSEIDSDRRFEARSDSLVGAIDLLNEKIKTHVDRRRKKLQEGLQALEAFK